jgi:hypothetical protein
MSNVNPNNPNLEGLDEELVAYLDGELEPQAAQRIENVLAADAQARERLSQLASSWDLLDQLPRATVDDLFTRTTVEMVALAAEDEIKKTVAAEPARRRMRLVGGGIAALVAVVVGFVAVALALPDHNEDLLRDLPVVRDLDLYIAVGDINLLKLFQENRLFTEDPQAAAQNVATSEKSTSHVSSLSLPIPDSIGDRRGWIEGLSAADKTELRRNFDKFSAKPEAEQQSLRKLDAQLRADPQAADLHHIMLRYQDWRNNSLQPTDRADLDEKTPKERVADIKQKQQDREQRALTRLAMPPGGPPGGPGMSKGQDNVRPIVGWLQKYALNHEQEILDQLPDDLKEQSAKNKKQDDRGGRPSYPFWLVLQLTRPDSPVVKLPALNEAESREFRDMIEGLPQVSKDKLKELRDNEAKLVQMRSWVQAAMRSRQFGGPGGFGRGGGMRKSIRDELTPEETAQLQGLTGADLFKKEMELYRQKHGLPENWPRPGDGPKGPPGEGPAGPSMRDGGPPPHEPPPRDNPPSS